MNTTVAPDRTTNHPKFPTDSVHKPHEEAVMLSTSSDHIISSDPAVVPLAPDSPRPPGDEQPWELPDGQARRLPVARCADGHGTLTALFFSDNVHDIARAKAMCGLCPLSEQCLADALAREEPWGVWGGELLSGGRVIANKRPCGRPPKHPRPELVYDEMGPVGVVA